MPDPSPDEPDEVKTVDPADPDAAKDAATTEPGEVEEIQAEGVKREHKPSEEDEKKKKSWIEIELVGEDGKPYPGEAYEIELPDGSVATGTLDEKGYAKVKGLEPGTVNVTFPYLDKDAWEPA